MVSNIFLVIFYSLVAGLATLVSGLFIIKNKKISEKTLIYLVSFSAGILLALAFFHILPEALTLVSDNAFLGLVLAFLFFYLLEQRIMMHSCAEGGCEHHHVEKGKGLIGLWGIMIHSLIDGALIGIGFEVNFALGLATALAVLVHKIPDGISVSSIMIHGGFKKENAVKGIIFVALATPIGAFLSYLLLQSVPQSVIGIALGVSAGTFLYISASDLIPETHEKFNPFNGLFVVLGVLAIILLKSLI